MVRAATWLAVLVGMVSTVSADVLHMPAGLTSLELVTVGNPGNAPDTRYATPGYGAVSYTYQIGKYEVTSGQYCEFLNAVAKTDTYGLYSVIMSSPIGYGCKIMRSGSPGSYTYSVAADYANRPVNYTSFWDACRFVNWLHNGQPTGAQGAGTTETGAYMLNGYMGSDGRTIQRIQDAQWALPSEDEWYKAAYHKNDGATGNYFDYPTSSDTVPSNVLGDPTDPGNNATYYDYYGTGSGGMTIGSPYYRTEVGDHENSGSSYGTFDQGGNVTEWNEAIVYQSETASRRGARGEAFYGSPGDCLHASYRTAGTNPSDDPYIVGFRVVYIPEPASVLLVAIGCMAVVRRRRTR